MSFTPPNIPSFSVVAPPEQQLAQAAQKAPQDNAEREAAVATAKAQTGQAQLAEQQTNDQLLQRLVAPAIQNPAVAASPQWQKLVQDKLTASGMQIPKSPDGQIDLQALQGLVAPVVKMNLDPESAMKAAQIPAGPAREAFLSLFNPASVSKELANAPLIPTDKEKELFAKDYDSQALKAEQGLISPQAFLTWAKGMKQNLSYLGINFEDINNNDLIVAGLGAKTRADIERLTSMGILDKAKGALALENISKAKTVEALNAARVQYLGEQGHALSVKEQAMLSNAAVNSERANAYVADVTQRIATAQNGSWADRQKLLSQDVGNTIRMLNAAQADRRMIAISMQNARNNGEDPTVSTGGQPSLADSYQEAGQRVTALEGVLSQVRSTTTTANAAAGLLNAVGGAGTTNTLPGQANIPDKSTLLPSKTNPNLFMDPATKVIWDYSAQPPKMVGKAQ